MAYITISQGAAADNTVDVVVPYSSISKVDVGMGPADNLSIAIVNPYLSFGTVSVEQTEGGGGGGGSLRPTSGFLYPRGDS